MEIRSIIKNCDIKKKSSKGIKLDFIDEFSLL